MTTNTYNGWTGVNGSNGYETWLVNIWLGSDLQDLAQERYEETGEKMTGDDIKTYVEEIFEDQMPTEGFLADMLNGAFGSVNWHELADNLEYEEPEPENDDVEDLKSEFKLHADSGDAWGSVMASLFDIAAELTRRGDDVPEAWQYQAGAAGPHPRDEYVFDLSDYTSDCLRTFGDDYLHRAVGILKRLGRDY